MATAHRLEPRGMWLQEENGCHHIEDPALIGSEVHDSLELDHFFMLRLYCYLGRCRVLTAPQQDPTRISEPSVGKLLHKAYES